MQIELFSRGYRVRQLTVHDAKEVFALYMGNPQYFDAMSDASTIEGAKHDLTALPPNKTHKDKFYLGFYEGETLAAVIDLILAYPNEQIAFIGLFMVNAAHQGKGIGTQIVKDTLEYLKVSGYSSVRLGYVESNPQSRRFWERNGFTPTGDKSKQEKYTIILMEKEL